MKEIIKDSLKESKEDTKKIVIKAKKTAAKNSKKKLWDKAKDKPEFAEFEKLLLEEYDYEIDDLEAAYSYTELLKAFKAYLDGDEFEL